MSIIKWFKGIINGKSTVCFIPYGRVPNDMVYALHKSIMGLMPDRVYCVVDNNHGSKVACFTNPTGYMSSKKLAIFGHPSLSRDGIAVNPSPADTSEVLYSHQCLSNNSRPLLFAHICEGYQILISEHWANAFPYWLTYDREIKSFLGTPKGKWVWAGLLKSLIDCLDESKNSVDLLYKARIMYNKTMLDISDSLNILEGDRLNMTYIEISLQALVSNETVR